MLIPNASAIKRTVGLTLICLDEWRKLGGDEIVTDAGCGSRLLTKLLSKKVPKGKVYAVDVDSNMIRQG